MVPLAIGSQTNGSIVRPGAYCGVYGYKPTRGLIPLKGALAQSRPLDTAGVFANSVADAALMAEQIMSAGEQGAWLLRPTLLATALQEPPALPRIAFVKTPIWPNADPDAKEAFVALAGRLSDCVSEVALPDWAGDGLEWHRIIMESDLARSFHREYESGKDRLSERLRGMIESGQKHLAVDYNNALDRAADLGRVLDQIFADYDAILTPATTGSAPHGLEQTGSPMFCTLWTLCGVPAITLPLLKGASGLPLGVQLVGARGNDGRLLRTARWLANRVGEMH
jgi:Asp-tRNA(Asn)/Glu-tRNA(Gln) amidotransferase A subunit family amidase